MWLQDHTKKGKKRLSYPASNKKEVKKNRQKKIYIDEIKKLNHE